MADDSPIAPGRPGLPPRWTSSAKSGVGTAVGLTSLLWFTLAEGIVTEVYYPDVDKAAVRDLSLLVADGKDFFSDEKQDAEHALALIAPGVPGYRMTSTCSQGRYRIVKTVIADPRQPVLLVRVHFEALQGEVSDYGLYALLAPHLDNHGGDNSGWAWEYKGVPMLFAQRGDAALALACSAGFAARSCGYVGVSDGWQDLRAHKRLAWTHAQAPMGNVALTGQIPTDAPAGDCVLALGFGHNPAEAGERARAGLLQDFDAVARAYTAEWQGFQSRGLDLRGPDAGDGGPDLYRVSTAVLKTHDSKHFPGGLIASLSLPWGAFRGDGDLGGYHMIWPRDQVEAAGALLAAGDAEEARQTLFFLMCTQEADGHWPQNMWINGTPYWGGTQMDETALPVLLADALRRRDALAGLDLWATVRRAAGFLVRRGPATPQDRWEENAGYSPFTLATEIAALLAAADFTDAAGDTRAAGFLRETADAWNADIERWTYVTGTDLARQVGVDGYYVRITPPQFEETGSIADTPLTLKNRPPGQDRFSAADIVSPDALALVRYGLRAPDDPRIVNTVQVIDACLRVETKTGPVWRRYNHDGYGEHADGRPFDGTGIGRGWPLLAGERAHYALAAGDRAEAERLLAVLARQTSPGGLLPEQVWDADDIPARGLFNGRPSGSGMPLVWAHAELVKLVRSLHDGTVFDTPPQTVARYRGKTPRAAFTPWRFASQTRSCPRGRRLRVEVLTPAVVRWSADGWHTVRDTETEDSGFGLHYADLPTEDLPEGAQVAFTFCWEAAGHWEGRNFEVRVGNG